MDANSLVVGINELAGLLVSLGILGGVLWWLIDIRNQKTQQPVMNKLTEVSVQIGEHQKYTMLQFEDIKHQQSRHFKYIQQVDAEQEDTKKELTKTKVNVAEIRGRLNINGE